MARSRASRCSAETGFLQNSLDEFSTSGRKFITALNRNRGYRIQPFDVTQDKNPRVRIKTYYIKTNPPQRLRLNIEYRTRNFECRSEQSRAMVRMVVDCGEGQSAIASTVLRQLPYQPFISTNQKSNSGCIKDSL